MRHILIQDPGDCVILSGTCIVIVGVILKSKASE
jgi:hypothetical protein